MICFFVLDARVAPLQGDEFLTFHLSTATSWREFLSVYSGHESNPFIYYVINNLIFRGLTAVSLGTPEFILRLQSLIWALAFVGLAWKAGRRDLSQETAWFSLLLVTMSSSFIYYVDNARPYTLLCFSVALALVVSSKSALTSSTGSRLSLIFLTFAFLANSHTFGVIYGFLITSGVAIYSLYHQRFWKSQVVASICGLATVIISFPLILQSTAVRSWVPIPSLTTGYLQIAMQINYEPYLICIVLACILSVFLAQRNSPFALELQPLSSHFVVMLAAASACIIIIPLVFVESHFFRPLFWPRYFLGLSFVYFIVFGLLTKLVFDKIVFCWFSRELRWALCGLMFLLAAMPVFGAKYLYARGPTAAELLVRSPPIAFVAKPSIDVTSLRDLPVVFNHDGIFTLFSEYANRGKLQSRFLELENILSADQIAREVGASFGSEAARKSLVYVAEELPLDVITAKGAARLTRIGAVTLPYFGGLGTIYLLESSLN